ncbi:MAG: hypothetical protein ACF788_06100 [Novipirellula sp. JB048]
MAQIVEILVEILVGGTNRLPHKSSPRQILVGQILVGGTNRRSLVGGTNRRKSSFRREAGHDVLNPALDDDDFDTAVRTAQTEYDQHQPDVIVGSSRGGAVAINIKSGETTLVLLCPAWQNWGTARTVKANTVILYCRADDVIPFC